MLPKSQVTHDRPQIFPIDRFLSPSKAIAEIVQLLFEFPTANMETATGDMPKLERRSSAPVKRRVSRACDHCHRMRTRCNGQSPCSRCIELEYVCQYQREKKRRGKVCHSRACISSGWFGVCNPPSQTCSKISRHSCRVADADLHRCQGIYKSSAKRLPLLGIVRKRQLDYQAATSRGLVVSRRWMTRSGPSQKQHLWCSTSLAKVCRRKGTGSLCSQVFTIEA
jgi:hypothetical protein